MALLFNARLSKAGVYTFEKTLLVFQLTRLGDSGNLRDLATLALTTHYMLESVTFKHQLPRSEGDFGESLGEQGKSAIE
jgi:hypothetical protein